MACNRLWLDTETFSATPIKWGTYRYVEDSELMVATWAFNDERIQTIDLTAGQSVEELEMALFEADEVIAHNAMFDRNVVRKHMRYCPAIEKWRCTMVKALAHSLPGGLEKVCEILQVVEDLRKQKIGKELIKLFCMPRPKNNKLQRATRHTHPVEWQQFLEYAATDTDASRAADGLLPKWNYGDNPLAPNGEPWMVKSAGRHELDLWHLDQRINDRGFAIDKDLCEAAIRAVAKEQESLRGQVMDATDGQIESATKRDQVLEYLLSEYGILLPDLKKSTLERRLADETIDEGVKELIRIRLQATTTSTAKYQAALRGEVGGRLRGTSQFCGALRTGRWAHRMFQPGNLPRPKFSASEIDHGIRAIIGNGAHLVYENVMLLTSSALRGVIVAPKGRKLNVADLANIEGRDQAWLAGEEWKLQAFRDYDTLLRDGGGLLIPDGKGGWLRLGEDLYKVAYAKSFKMRPQDVDKGQRQIGKVQELALGYEGGVGAFYTFSLLYGVDLEKMAREAWELLPPDLVREAEEFWEWTLKQKRPTFGLSREAFIVCDVFKRAWRKAHPNIASLWRELESTCIDAVESPGMTMKCRRFKIRRDGAWLRINLPSGRALCYPKPKVKDGKLSYTGVNQYTRQWQRISTYGGKLFENCCQATARDIMAWNMPAMEQQGYLPILTVHDEVLTESEDTDEFTHEKLSTILATNPPWATDIPLAAAGFSGYRYRKDD